METDARHGPKAEVRARQRCIFHKLPPFSTIFHHKQKKFRTMPRRPSLQKAVAKIENLVVSKNCGTKFARSVEERALRARNTLPATRCLRHRGTGAPGWVFLSRLRKAPAYSGGTSKRSLSSFLPHHVMSTLRNPKEERELERARLYKTSEILPAKNRARKCPARCRVRRMLPNTC